jgi:hypothetical protein
MNERSSQTAMAREIAGIPLAAERRLSRSESLASENQFDVSGENQLC